MIGTALTYLVEADSFAAIEYLNRQKDPLAVVDAYAKLVLQLYWEEKDLPARLTDEEKEIISNREMLELLPLLQNLDKIKFIDLLNEMEPDWSEKEESDEEKAENEEGNKP